MILSVRKFGYRLVYDQLERCLPSVVQLFQSLVSADAILGEPGDKILGRLRIFLSNHALVFDGGLAILFTFLLVSALASHRAENGRCR